MAPEVPFPHARHFVLAFKDGTLEAVAQDVVVRERFRSYDDALRWMSREIGV